MRLRKAAVVLSLSSYAAFVVWLLASFLMVDDRGAAAKTVMASVFLALLLMSKLLQVEFVGARHDVAAALLQSLCGFFFIAWLFLWAGGAWLSLSPQLSGLSFVMFLAGIVYAVAAVVVAGVRRPAKPCLIGKPTVIKDTVLYAHGKLTVVAGGALLAEKVRYGGQASGFMCHGEAAVTVDTPHGLVNKNLSGLFVMMTPSHFPRGEAATNVEAETEDAKRFGYTTLGDFIQRARETLEANEGELRKRFEVKRRGLPPFFTFESSQDLVRLHIAPLVDFERTPDSCRVKIGPVTALETPDVEEVRLADVAVVASPKPAPRSRSFGYCHLREYGSGAVLLQAGVEGLSVLSDVFSLVLDGDVFLMERGNYSAAIGGNRRRLVAPEYAAETSVGGWARLRCGAVVIETYGSAIDAHRGGEVEHFEHAAVARRIYDAIDEIVGEGATKVVAGVAFDAAGIMRSMQYFLEMLEGIRE